MSFKEVLLGFKNLLNRIMPSKFNFDREEFGQCVKLTSLPGIGENNCRVFYDAGYTTPESIILAKDEELMNIPGVGIAFIKKLREYQKKD